MIPAAMDIPMSPLPAALVRIQDPRYRRQHPQANPHLFLLFVSDDFIFQSS